MRRRTTRRSLQEYAKAHGCFLCHVPERVEVEKARASGIETRVIARWLIEDRGYAEDVILKAKGSMGGHFANHCKETSLISLGRKR